MKTGALIFIFALAGCSAGKVELHSEAAFSGDLSALVVTVNQSPIVTVSGGVAPFTYSPTGISGWQQISSNQFQFNRQWNHGASTINIEDSIGNIHTTVLTLTAGGHTLSGGPATNTIPVSMLQDNMGNFFICGTTSGTTATIPALQYGNHGDSDVYLAKISPSGNLLWVSQLGGGTGSVTLPAQLEFGTDNKIIISGSTNGTLRQPSSPTQGGEDTFIASFDNISGELNWVSQLGGGTGFFTDPFQIVVEASGNVLVVGVTEGDLGGTHFGTPSSKDTYLASYNISSGSLNWVKQLGGGGFITQPTQVLAGSSGEIYVSGYNDGILGGDQLGVHGTTDAYLASFSRTNGNLKWVTQLGGGAGSTSQSTQLSVGPSGKIYISGFSNGTVGSQIGTHGSRDSFLAKYDSVTGTSLWRNQLGGGASTSTQPFLMSLGANEEIYVSGISSGIVGSQIGTHGTRDSFLAKYDSVTGTSLWRNQLGGDPTSSTQPSQMKIKSNGEIVISGTSTGSSVGTTQLGSHGGLDFYLAKYNQTSGAPSWRVQLGGGAGTSTQPNQIEFGSNGEVIVAGSSGGQLDGSQFGMHGLNDSYISSHSDSTGSLNWRSQLGAENSNATSIKILLDTSYNIFLLGSLDNSGRIDGYSNVEVGTTNSFLSKFNSVGEMQ
jgi:hypothetical protein